MIREVLKDQRGHVRAAARAPIAAAHLRKDAWWALPLTVVVVLLSFIVYSTWAAFQNAHYFAAPSLSPFYSPCISKSCVHATFGYGLPDFTFPVIGIVSPAFLILWGPGLFRLTCYYYRKAYYRSFVASPPGCAVSPGERPRYHGETRVLIFQNLHRYALYFALLFILILGWDAIQSFSKDGRLGIGVGSLVLTVNVILIASYTFGCHSFRHLIGGRSDCMSCGQATLQYKSWKGASWFNARHMQFAWASLLWVVFTDVYVRLVSMGVIKDLNTWS